MEVKDKKLCSF